MNLDPMILAELMRGGPPLWVSGRTYPAGFVVRSPGNLQSYVRVTAGAGNADPSGGDANWMLSSKRVESAVGAVLDSVSAARTEAGWWRDAVQNSVTAVRDSVSAGRTEAGVWRDEVKAAVNAARDSVWAQVVDCHATVRAVRDLAGSIKATVEGLGIKSVQRGVFIGTWASQQTPTYDIPISPVDPGRATLTLLTSDMSSNEGANNKSIALAPDGRAVRSYASNMASSSYFPSFSWEVIEWKR